MQVLARSTSDKPSRLYNEELEQAVLGAIMLESGATTSVTGSIEPGVFYFEKHQLIYQAVLSLFVDSHPIDLLTVTDKLRKEGTLEKVGGAYYITSVTTRVNSAANIEYHIKVLEELALKRTLLGLIPQLTQLEKDTEDVFEFYEHFIDMASSSIDKFKKNNVVSLRESAKEVIKETLFRIENPSELRGVPSGLTMLDRKTMGFQDTDLIILAARPGMGKTATALKFARSAATFNFPVAFFSLEMSSDQLTRRIISAEHSIENDYFKKAGSSPNDIKELERITNRVLNLPIYIDDTPGLGILEMRARARRMKDKYGIKLIIVDYLQLASGLGGRNEGNREQEIGAISRGLKNMAKEMKVPVVALSQLSRAVETRGGDKKPRLSDLRESGSIEQDADIVMFAYRPEYYDIYEDEEGMPTVGLMQLIIAKNRHGGLGEVNAKFVAKYTDVQDANDFKASF